MDMGRGSKVLQGVCVNEGCMVNRPTGWHAAKEVGEGDQPEQECRGNQVDVYPL